MKFFNSLFLLFLTTLNAAFAVTNITFNLTKARILDVLAVTGSEAVESAEMMVNFKGILVESMARELSYHHRHLLNYNQLIYLDEIERSSEKGYKAIYQLWKLFTHTDGAHYDMKTRLLKIDADRVFGNMSRDIIGNLRQAKVLGLKSLLRSNATTGGIKEGTGHLDIYGINITFEDGGESHLVYYWPQHRDE